MDGQHRRELKRDKFVDEVGSWTTRARENQRALLGLTIAVVLVAVIAYGIYFYRSNRENQAQAALGAAIDAIDSPLIQPVNPANPTPNPGARFKTADERNSRSEVMFRDVQTRFSGSDSADVANIYLARIAAARNDVTTAKKLLSSFIEEHPKHILVGAARFSLYQLRLNNGEAPQVIAELNQQLASTGEQALPADTLLSLLAQAYDAQGNGGQARETLRRIVTQFPDSPYVLEAQRRIGTTT